ncbi:MAG TPA: DUF4115 domain-containing protein, partial [Chromatiaceae bacterium]|nr:DUF4115 domain-containing protein [Chromatiaceae bacterium]
TLLAVAGPVARESSAPPVVEQAKEEQAKEEQVVEVAEVADTSPAVVAEPSISEPTAGSKVVELRFSEDSWVDVRGADGSFKVVGTRKAGETLRLGGKPPYHIILGNARGVSLLVNGTPHDLAASTRRNVARLTLDL